MNRPNCNKCPNKPPMEVGKAILPTWQSGLPDFIGDRRRDANTIVPQTMFEAPHKGEAPLTDVWKCPQCGHSITTK